MSAPPLKQPVIFIHVIEKKMKRIHETSAMSGTGSVAMRLKNSTAIIGFVTDSVVKPAGDYHKNLVNHQYSVVVIDTSISASNESSVRQIPNGFRVVSSAQMKASNDVVLIYEKILLAHYKDNETVAKIMNQCRDNDYFRANLDVGPFKTWSKFDVFRGQRLTFSVTVGQSEPLIQRGNIIEAKSIHVKLWGKKPDKGPAAAAPAAAEGAPESSAAAAAAEDTPSRADDGVPDFLLGYAKTITPLLGADLVTLADVDTTDMSSQHVLKTLVPIFTQKIAHNTMIVLPVVSDDVLSDDAEKTGLVIGVNEPGAYDSKKGESSGPRVMQTYTYENSARLPINVSITSYVRVKRTEATVEMTAKLTVEYPTVTDDPVVYPDEIIYSRNDRVVGRIYASGTSKSGFADATNFAHVNAYKNIPCTVLGRLTDSPVSDHEKKVSVVHVEWDTKKFVIDNSFPIPNDFAWTILDRKPTTGGITSFGMETGFDKKTHPLRNESNEQRGHVDLLLANEANVPIGPYMDPANGWKARLMMVPNQDEFTRKQDAQKAAILNVIAQGNALKTEAEGEAFVRDYVAKYSDDMTLATFGFNTARHRIFVWFYKPDAGIYKDDVPVYTQLRGNEQQPPPNKKQRSDAVEEKKA